MGIRKSFFSLSLFYMHARSWQTSRKLFFVKLTETIARRTEIYYFGQKAKLYALQCKIFVRNLAANDPLEVFSHVEGFYVALILGLIRITLLQIRGSFYHEMATLYKNKRHLAKLCNLLRAYNSLKVYIFIPRFVKKFFFQRTSHW